VSAQLAPDYSSITTITALPNGIHEGVPAEVYHRKELGVVNCGALKALSKTAAHYRAWLAEEQTETPALAFGKALHCAVLEPELFERTYIVAREHPYSRVSDRLRNAKKPSQGTLDAIAYWDAWEREMGGKIEVSHDDAIALRGMQAAVFTHPIAGKLFTGGVAESTAIWTDPEHDLLCKARMDYYVASRGLVIDLKSTEDASESGFARSVATYRYHVQHAHYASAFQSLGHELRAFLFVAVEKAAPYAVNVMCLDADAEARGMELRDRDMATLNRCLQTDTWPGYEPTIHRLALPRWALND
jgi:exodeoxyribonuclease VIII